MLSAKNPRKKRTTPHCKHFKYYNTMKIKKPYLIGIFFNFFWYSFVNFFVRHFGRGQKRKNCPYELATFQRRHLRTSRSTVISEMGHISKRRQYHKKVIPFWMKKFKKSVSLKYTTGTSNTKNRSKSRFFGVR